MMGPAGCEWREREKRRAFGVRGSACLTDSPRTGPGFFGAASPHHPAGHAGPGLRAFRDGARQCRTAAAVATPLPHLPF